MAAWLGGVVDGLDRCPFFEDLSDGVEARLPAVLLVGFRRTEDVLLFGPGLICYITAKTSHAASSGNGSIVT